MSTIHNAAFSRRHPRRDLRSLFGGLVCLVATACSSGSKGGASVPAPGPAPLTVGGNLSGLATGTVVVEITGGERLTLAQDGPFVFQTPFQLGNSYAVTVVTAPTKAFTELARASGLVAGDVRDIGVVITSAFQVSGAVTGLTGRLVLELNASERVTLTGSGSFTFNTLLRDGASYSIAVVEAPPGERWLVSSGNGQITGGDVTTVAVYADRLRTIGGTVAGLRGGLVLRNNGGDDLIVSADGAFTFGTSVATSGAYDVQVRFKPPSQRVTVRNGAGTVGVGNVTTVDVICENKAWTHPATLSDTISPDGNDADGVVLASGLRGDAIVAWEYGSRVYASERRNGVWRHPVRDVTPPHNPAGGSTFDLRAAIDPQNNTLLAWSQHDAGVERIYASLYRNGTWRDPSSHADHLSPTAGDALQPQLVFDVAGDGYLVWQQYVSGNGRIFLATYHDGVWTKPASATDGISPDTTHAQDVRVAVSSGGHVVVVWAQADNHNYRIYKSEMRNNTWTHPSSLTDCISPAGSDAYAPDVAFDGSGNAVITWVQSDGANQQVFKSEFRAGSWRYPTSVTDNISPDGQAVHSASVAMARSGQAVIVWRQDVSATDNRLFKSEYRAGTWTHPASLTSGFSIGTNVTGFAVAMDTEGNIVLPYTATESGGTAVLLESEYRGGVWVHPTALTDRISPPGGDVTQPHVTVDGNDDVIIMWRQHNGTNQHAFISEYR